MTRAISSVTTKKKHKKILKLAKGYRGRSSTCYRIALQRVENALRDSYKDRKRKKRDFRALWIQQINAAVREQGYRYSDFIAKMRDNNFSIDRKSLADLAINNNNIFCSILSKCFQDNVSGLA